MIALLLVIARQSGPVHLRPLWSAPLAHSGSLGYNIHVLFDGKAIAFELPQDARGIGTYILNTVKCVVTFRPNERIAEDDSDCGASFVTFLRPYDGDLPGLPGRRIADTYDKNWNKLSSLVAVEGDYRVGRVFVSQAHMQTGFSVTHTSHPQVFRDPMTGEPRHDMPPDREGNPHVPVWDSGRKRLLVVPTGKELTESRELGEFRTGEKTASRKASFDSPLSGFRFNIVGNPEGGDFALISRSAQSLSLAGIYSESLQRIKLPVNYVTDIGPKGILGEIGIRDSRGTLAFQRLDCFRPTSHALLWSIPCRGSTSEPGPRWAGSYVVTMNEVLDGANGQTIGKLPLSNDGKTIGWVGDVLYRIENSSQQIVAYQLSVATNTSDRAH